MAVKETITSHYRKAKDFYFKYERFLVPALLVGGFIVDYITFASFEIDFTLLFLAVHWLIAGLAIAFMHMYDAGRLGRLPLWTRYVRLYCPLIIQFMFGVLLRFSLIFYWFYGAFSVSWPLLAIIVILMVVHDRFRHYFDKPIVQLSVYFFVTLSFFSVTFPFVFNSSSVWPFIAALVVSIGLFALYLYYLSRAADVIHRKMYPIILCVGIITIVMNGMYFGNITPPIPLALRDAGVYHGISFNNAHYTVLGEKQSLLDALLQRPVLHLQPSERAFLYTAIFAPSDLTTTIIDRWQYYDTSTKDWVTMATPALTITGGRQDGYKGFTWFANPKPGKWRVSVENKRGQVLGKIVFTVERTTGNVQLQKYIK